MILYLADHCFDEDILRAVQRRARRDALVLDVVLARDVGLARAKDGEFLAWAADHARAVLTHDRNTLVGLAHQRVRSGNRMPGVVVVDQFAPDGQIAGDLLLLTFATSAAEWEGQVHYLPL